MLSDDYKKQHSPSSKPLQQTFYHVCEAVLSCHYPHMSVKLCATTVQKHQPRSLLQLPYIINNTKYKHTKLSPKLRLSLTSRRDVSDQLVPMPQLQGNTRQRLNNLLHLLTVLEVTCSLTHQDLTTLGRKKTHHKHDIFNMGRGLKGKKKKENANRASQRRHCYSH